MKEFYSSFKCFTRKGLATTNYKKISLLWSILMLKKEHKIDLKAMLEPLSKGHKHLGHEWAL
jgi:hypothetical protein